jgi:tagatose 1,6-diphosphate aldolase GatY/KbaY
MADFFQHSAAAGGLGGCGAADLLLEARAAGRAVGAFNVYNLEGAIAVRRAAEACGLPAIVQLHPASLEFGGAALLAACNEIAQSASVPILVALDHACDDAAIDNAIATGMVQHVMADGSHLSLPDNQTWTRAVAKRAHDRILDPVSVEAELGKLAGFEDGLVVALRDAKMTDPAVVAAFIEATGIDALAVTIGNVHGKYSSEDPPLDWARLDAIRAEAGGVPLVLHGASGLPGAAIQRAIANGVTKFNVNTEVRAAACSAVAGAVGDGADVLPTMLASADAMQRVIEDKIRAFAPGKF